MSIGAIFPLGLIIAKRVAPSVSATSSLNPDGPTQVRTSVAVFSLCLVTWREGFHSFEARGALTDHFSLAVSIVLELCGPLPAKPPRNRLEVGQWGLHS